MKNNSEFLPVPPFWKQRKPSHRSERVFCLGIITGTILTMLAAWLIIWATNHTL